MKAFGWPDIRARATVDGVVAVVDGPAVAAGRFADDLDALAKQRAADPSLDHDNPLEEVFEDQLLAADLVILNKADLLGAEAMKAVEAQIEAVLPRAVKLVHAQHGAIPASKCCSALKPPPRTIFTPGPRTTTTQPGTITTISKASWSRSPL